MSVNAEDDAVPRNPDQQQTPDGDYSMETSFVDTSTHMVQIVKNAIESYGMGSI